MFKSEIVSRGVGTRSQIQAPERLQIDAFGEMLEAP
jgi:hypothetical protein